MLESVLTATGGNIVHVSQEFTQYAPAALLSVSPAWSPAVSFEAMLKSDGTLLEETRWTNGLANELKSSLGMLDDQRCAAE